jgi:COPII coat assembly protein SEC16
VRPAKQAAAANAAKATAAKKGWGLGGWFGSSASSSPAPDSSAKGKGGKEGNLDAPSNKPIRAKLGESNSFIYDPDQKRWINKKAGAEDTAPKKAAPPPPRAAGPAGAAMGQGMGVRSVSSSPAPPMGAGAPPRLGLVGSQSMMGLRQAAQASAALGTSNSNGPPGPGPAMGGPPAMVRSASNTSAPGQTGPPSRPATALSNSSSIDDLLGPPGAGGGRKGPKKARKGGRYVDVMGQ